MNRKKKPEDDKKPDTGKKAETGGAAINLSGQLFKKGSGGLKKTEKRDMKIDGTVLKYYKKKDDEKTAKKIELKAAEISDGGEKKGQYWMKIKIQEGKDKGKIREIAAMSKDDSKKWMDALKAVATGAGTPTPEKKTPEEKKPDIKESKTEKKRRKGEKDKKLQEEKRPKCTKESTLRIHDLLQRE